MKLKTDDFRLQVDGVNGVCPAGEAWGEQQILEMKPSNIEQKRRSI